jgi:large subunit ribosomal protein L5
MNRLQEKYNNSVKAELVNKFNYSSSMEIPKESILLNE